MRPLWPQLASWIDSDKPFALATVIQTDGSAPRAPGSCMAISADGLRFIGSVSSGCLDAEVLEAGAAVLASGEEKLLHFSRKERSPFREALSCGGGVHIRVEPWWAFSPSPEVRSIAPLLRSWLEHDEPGVLLSAGCEHLALSPSGDATGNGIFDAKMRALALERLALGLPPAELPSERGPVFVRTLPRRPRLFLIGAVDIAVTLVPMARAAGFSVWVIDPRRAYADPGRFPVPPDRLLHAWPAAALDGAPAGPRDAAVVLAHDPKIDDPALLTLLDTQIGYLGALGSKRSHEARLERLRLQRNRQETLQRIHGPAGLHLGSSNTATIAVGILAGIVAWQAQTEQSSGAPEEES